MTPDELAAEIPGPEMLAERRVQTAEHEVLLSFNSDWHAAAFQDWLQDEGRALYRAWAVRHKDDYVW